jgi:hypothetical protein
MHDAMMYYGRDENGYGSCSVGHVSACFGLFQLILSHRTLLNQPKSAVILPAEHSHERISLISHLFSYSCPDSDLNTDSVNHAG